MRRAWGQSHRVAGEARRNHQVRLGERRSHRVRQEERRSRPEEDPAAVRNHRHHRIAEEEQRAEAAAARSRAERPQTDAAPRERDPPAECDRNWRRSARPVRAESDSSGRSSRHTPRNLTATGQAQRTTAFHQCHTNAPDFGFDIRPAFGIGLTSQTRLGERQLDLKVV